MNSQEDTDYRLSLARGFRDAAERDFARSEWASCVEHAQLAVENAAKAVIACFGPAPRTHEPKDDLEEIVNTSANLPSETSIAIQRIISSCNDLGTRAHILAAYRAKIYNSLSFLYLCRDPTVLERRALAAGLSIWFLPAPVKGPITTAPTGAYYHSEVRRTGVHTHENALAPTGRTKLDLRAFWGRRF